MLADIPHVWLRGSVSQLWVRNELHRRWIKTDELRFLSTYFDRSRPVDVGNIILCRSLIPAINANGSLSMDGIVSTQKGRPEQSFLHGWDCIDLSKKIKEACLFSYWKRLQVTWFFLFCCVVLMVWWLSLNIFEIPVVACGFFQPSLFFQNAFVSDWARECSEQRKLRLKVVQWWRFYDVSIRCHFERAMITSLLPEGICFATTASLPAIYFSSQEESH